MTPPHRRHRPHLDLDLHLDLEEGLITSPLTSSSLRDDEVATDVDVELDAGLCT